MQSKNDEELLEDVFKIRDRLVKTKNSIRKLNDFSKSVNEASVQQNDSVLMPPPLTMDDLGHNDSDLLRPIDESVLRQWNLNATNLSEVSRSSHSESVLRNAKSPKKFGFESNSARASFQDSYDGNPPQTSSPNDRFRALGARAFSCSNLPASSSTIMDVVEADSYRMLKQPSFTSYTDSLTSNKSASSIRGSNSRSKDFEPIQGEISDISINLRSRSEESTPSKSFSRKENITPRPISARSNATSVTLLGLDAESERLRSRLSTVRSDNENLHDLVQELRQQLKSEKNIYQNDIVSKTKELERLKEENIMLNEERQSNETALKKAEDSVEQFQMNLNNKTDTIKKLKSDLSNLQAKLKEESKLKLQAIAEQREAFNDAQVMAERLDIAHAKINEFLDLENREGRFVSEIKHLKQENAYMTAEVSSLKNKSNELKRLLRESNSTLEKLKQNEIEMQHKYQKLNSINLEDKEKLMDANTEVKSCKDKIKSLSQELENSSKKVTELSEQNSRQKDHMLSCQRELDEARKRQENLRRELNEKQRLDFVSLAVDSGLGGSRPTSQNTVQKDYSELRELRAELTEVKLRLESKQSHIERLESRLKSSAQESDRLEDIRSELVNVVERSRMGENRARELEAVIHTLEEERSKVMRQLIDHKDKVTDQTTEIKSLEARLKERTETLMKQQTTIDEMTASNDELSETLSKLRADMSLTKQQLGDKSDECTQHINALSQLTKEVTEKRRALDNAAEWTGKRESESRREIERIKTVHMEQHKEMEMQLENLEAERNKYRNQSDRLKCEVCRLQENKVVADDRIRSLEHEVSMFHDQNNEEIKINQLKLQQLEQKAAESSQQVSLLQSALSQCKDEISTHVEHLSDASNKFQHQIAMKSSEISKLESELKMAQDSLQCEMERAKSAERTYKDRQQMLEDAVQRVHELEEVQSSLESKVAELEKELTKREAKSQMAARETEVQLQTAMHEIETKNRQFAQLNDALKDVDKDFTNCRQELVTVEQQLNDLRLQSSEKSQILEIERAELKITKENLSKKTEEVTNLQSKLNISEQSRMNSQDKCLSLETDFAQCQAQIQGMTNDLSKFQSALEEKDIDILKKEGLLARMKNALREAQDVQSSQDCRHDELEKLLQEKDWNLKQHVAKVAKLEMELQEMKSSKEKNNITTSSEIKKLVIELKDRNSQIETLDDQLTSIRQELSEAEHLRDDRGQEVSRMKQDISHKCERIKELEKSLSESRAISEERHSTCMRLTTELREVREQLQQASVEWQSAQHELMRLQKQQKYLMDDLKRIGDNDQNKDDQVADLSSQLSKVIAEKDTVEQRYADELERLRNDVLKLHQKHQKEMSNLKLNHANELNRARNTDSDKSSELQKALDRENESRMELEKAKDLIASLEQELLARKKVIESANDAIVLKVAEIARLEAKLSEQTRAKQLHQEAMEPQRDITYNDTRYLPTFLQPGNNSPAHESRTHNASTLFSGLDPDNSSLAPSFLHVAASTKRQKPETRNINLEDNERSFVERVFNDFPEPDFDSTHDSEKFLNRFADEELAPKQCLMELEERLRNSEQRRKDVTEKLERLKESKLNRS